jgi:hypothetical protein
MRPGSWPGVVEVLIRLHHVMLRVSRVQPVKESALTDQVAGRKYACSLTIILHDQRH